MGARVVVPRTRCKLYTRASKLHREQPFYNMRPKNLKVEADATKLDDDDDVYAENGFYVVCQGVDLRRCPADDKLPMGQYELDLVKKHVGAHLCRRAADLETRPDVADELRNSAKKLDWGTKGVPSDLSFAPEDFLCAMSPLYNKERAKFLQRKEEARLDVLRAERKDFREARLAAKAAREQLDDAEAAQEAAMDAMEAEDMRLIAEAAARFERQLAAKAPPPPPPSFNKASPKAPVPFESDDLFGSDDDELEMPALDDEEWAACNDADEGDMGLVD